MTLEKWIVHPGESRVIDVDGIRSLKIGLVRGQVDVVAHDDPGVRIEVHSVAVKDLRIEAAGDALEIDHPQLRWDNFLDVFRNVGAGGPHAEISVAVPRHIALTLGVVSASALVSGLARDAKVNTVSGDILVDGLEGDLSANAVSGDLQVRDLTGALSATTVSGDVTASGRLRTASVDSVSGAVLIDADGPVQQISLNSIGGGATLRLDEGLPANYVVRSVSGRVLVDGVVRSGQGSGPATNFAGSRGELAGTFVDVRANTVSGDVTVLRRAAAVPDAPPAHEVHGSPSPDAPHAPGSTEDRP